MHYRILAVGEKMPPWCKLACEFYQKRLTPFIKCTLLEIPTTRRTTSPSLTQCKEEEGRKILQKVSSQEHVIALQVEGCAWSTQTLAKRCTFWQHQGKNITFLIGGPDGLSSSCLQRANEQWSLSPLTFPHALARILLLEQLYRAHSLLAHHPYHRE